MRHKSSDQPALNQSLDGSDSPKPGFWKCQEEFGLKDNHCFHHIFNDANTFFIQTLAIEVAAGFRIQESEKLGQLLNSVTYNLVPSRGL